jgi:hypothetical protein
MSEYKDARDKLSAALRLVTLDGPEWIKTKAAIAALDQSEVAKIEADFINASRRLDDAVAKLRAIVAGIQPNAASAFLDNVNGALATLTPLVEGVDALLAGEPATALPGMAETNQPEFPTAAEPVVPPVREIARPTPAAAPPNARSVDAMIDEILGREGGFVDHPNDRGGATNFGITQRALAASRGKDVSVDDVRNMAISEAKQIYSTRYFTRPKIDKLPELVQPVVFDMSINHGPGTAIKLFQEVLNKSGKTCSVDGGVGDETITCAQAAADALGNALINSVVDRRIALYQAIVAGDESQRVFLRGWLRRANEFRVS